MNAAPTQAPIVQGRQILRIRPGGNVIENRHVCGGFRTANHVSQIKRLHVRISHRCQRAGSMDLGHDRRRLRVAVIFSLLLLLLALSVGCGPLAEPVLSGILMSMFRYSRPQGFASFGSRALALRSHDIRAYSSFVIGLFPKPCSRLNTVFDRFFGKSPVVNGFSAGSWFLFDSFKSL